MPRGCIIHVVFTDMSSSMFGSLAGLLMMWLIYLSAGATCTPFVYNRGSTCSSNLAASTYPVCSSMNLTFKLEFCEIHSIGDLQSLQSVARVLGRSTVNTLYVFVICSLVTHYELKQIPGENKSQIIWANNCHSGAKQPIVRIVCFQIHFIEWKLVYSDSSATEVCA